MEAQGLEVLKTEMDGSSSRSRSSRSSRSSSLHSRSRHLHRHSNRHQPSSRNSLETRTDRSSVQVETKKGLEEDLLEIGWKMTGNGTGTVMMIERTVTVKGESGEGGALTGTGTETWTTETDAPVGIETETGILEIENLVERRRRTEERKSPRWQTGLVGTKPSNPPLAKREL